MKDPSLPPDSPRRSIPSSDDPIEFDDLGAEEADDTLPDSEPVDRLSELSTLQLLDLIRVRFEMKGIGTAEFDVLRERISELEDIQHEAMTAIEQLNQVIASC